MMSTSGSGTVDEVIIRKYVTLSIKDHIEKVQEAQDRLRNETASQLQEFSTSLTKLESSILQTSSTIKRTQDSCKYINKELETLRAKEKAAAELQAEAFNQTIADTIKKESAAAEKEMQRITKAHSETQQALHQASARASQELEALQQEMRAQQLAGALFSLRAYKLTEQRRIELIRELETQQVSLPTHFDKIIASPAPSPVPSAPPSEAGSSRAELLQQQLSRAEQQLSRAELQQSRPEQQLSRAPAADSSGRGSSQMQLTTALDERMERLEWKVELQQLAANIFCLRMMDAEVPLRESCLKKLESKHLDMSQGQRERVNSL